MCTQLLQFFIREANANTSFSESPSRDPGLTDISRRDPPPSRDLLPMFSSYVDLDRSACIIATKLIGLAFIFLELMRLELGSTSVFASGD